MDYEILSHTADAKFRAKGEELEDAFKASVKAFAEIVGADPEAGENRHRFEIESESHESLLFDFLDRLVFIQDTEQQAVTHAESIEVEQEEDGYVLEAEIWADPVTRGSGFLDVKAPTYNEMKAEYKRGEGWILEAVIDI